MFDKGLTTMQRKELTHEWIVQRNFKALKLLQCSEPVDLEKIKAILPHGMPLGRHMLGLAVSFGHNEVADYFMTPWDGCTMLATYTPADLGRALFYLILHDQITLAKKLISLHPTLDKSWIIIGMKETPLHLAILKEIPDLELVRMLYRDNKDPLIPRKKIQAVLNTLQKPQDITAENLIILLKSYLADPKKRNTVSQLFHPPVNTLKIDAVNKLLDMLINKTTLEMESEELKQLIKSSKLDRSILKQIISVFNGIKEFEGLRQAVTECFTLRHSNTYVEMVIDQEKCDVRYEAMGLRNG